MNSLPVIVIAGFMCSGKTAVARSLATQLNLDMIDLDEFITTITGRTPAQIIEQDGERTFRTIETEALADVLQAAGSGVIALGGGTWIEERNRELIKENGCLSIWLDTPFEVCWKRIQSSDEVRPLGKTEEYAKELFALRRPMYELAKVRLTTQADETSDEIATRLTGKLSGKKTSTDYTD